MNKTCDLCRQRSDEIIHLPLYVLGSEGINCCISCRIVLTKVAEGIRHSCATAYLQGRKDGKNEKS